MRLREREFLEARAQMLPVLIRKFHKYVKLARVQKGRIEYATDLAQETITQAFRNSINPIYDYFSCIDLIKMKANNVWADDWRKRQRSVPESRLDPIEFVWTDRDVPNQEENKPQTFQRLMELANSRQADILNKRLDNFTVNEIAAMYGCSPTVVSMQIRRLKIKFLSKKGNH